MSVDLVKSRLVFVLHHNDGFNEIEYLDGLLEAGQIKFRSLHVDMTDSIES